MRTVSSLTLAIWTELKELLYEEINALGARNPRGLKDSTKAALSNLDQSKAFVRVDHQFLVTVLETAGFQPEFCKWISMMYHSPQALVQVDGKRSKAFTIKRLFLQGFLLSSLIYILALETLLWRLRDEKASLVLCSIPFAGSLSAKVSAYADDITVFVSCRLGMKSVKNADARYEQIAEVKINFDKNEGLWLGHWRGGVPLPGPFRWSDGPIPMLGCCSGPGSKWCEIGRKYRPR